MRTFVTPAAPRCCFRFFLPRSFPPLPYPRAWRGTRPALAGRSETMPLGIQAEIASLSAIY